MKLILITIVIPVIIFGMLVLSSPSFAQQTPLNHPLARVTDPTTVGNGTVFQVVVIFDTKPVQDVGLAEYNKAVNFEKVKSKILNATFSDKMLKDITSDVEKQRSALLTEGTTVKRYYANGSTTLEYSDWWMQSYVTSRLDEDGLKAISSNLSTGMSMQDAIVPIDKEMQRIISNYDLNYIPPLQQLSTDNAINFTTSNSTKTLLAPNSHQLILNVTAKNIPSANNMNNNSVANTSKTTSAIPEFGPLAGMIVTISVIGVTMISRRISKT